MQDAKCIIRFVSFAETIGFWWILLVCCVLGLVLLRG